MGDAAVALCCGGGEEELVGGDAGLVLAEVRVRACLEWERVEGEKKKEE